MGWDGIVMVSGTSSYFTMYFMLRGWPYTYASVLRHLAIGDVSNKHSPLAVTFTETQNAADAQWLEEYIHRYKHFL